MDKQELKDAAEEQATQLMEQVVKTLQVKGVFGYTSVDAATVALALHGYSRAGKTGLDPSLTAMLNRAERARLDAVAETRAAERVAHDWQSRAEEAVAELRDARGEWSAVVEKQRAEVRDLQRQLRDAGKPRDPTDAELQRAAEKLMPSYDAMVDARVADLKAEYEKQRAAERLEVERLKKEQDERSRRFDVVKGAADRMREHAKRSATDRVAVEKVLEEHKDMLRELDGDRAGLVDNATLERRSMLPAPPPRPKDEATAPIGDVELPIVDREARKWQTIGDVELPWLAPRSHYDDDGAAAVVTVEGHTFTVDGGGGMGSDTGRTRWRVHCDTCNEEVHRGSTSATAQIKGHLSEVKRGPR